ncbi:hypothetical protein [Tomitella fengzijianii]|uniref:Uncharacterized protein n=1 Tax=Tomitella fengzijianii TaxID=2597660 RepID=A0A516X6F0_9ACTN|nr:hypothetical protein [Tomitella fengzijianii]QDQ98657.1 hypothetical protein FO059_16675 [Tomitella fengzijianii]
MSAPTTVTASAVAAPATRTGHPEIHVADFTGAGIITARAVAGGAGPADADGASSTDHAPHLTRTPAAGQPLSVAAAGDFVYFTTWSSPLGDGTVQRVPRRGGPAETVADGLHCPVGVAADAHTLFVTTFYGALHVFPRGGTPFRIDLSAHLENPNGIVLQGTTLYVVDWTAGAVAAIDTGELGGPGSTPAVRTVLRPGSLTRPGHIAAGDGVLYVTQTGSARGLDGTIERIDLRTESPRTETLAGRLAYPTGITLHDGTLYVSTVDSRSVVALDVDDPRPVQVVSGLETPWGLAI